jgi:hypothetical protein
VKGLLLTHVNGTKAATQVMVKAVAWRESLKDLLRQGF